MDNEGMPSPCDGDWITLSVVNDENAVELSMSRAEAIRLAANILVRLDQEGE